MRAWAMTWALHHNSTFSGNVRCMTAAPRGAIDVHTIHKAQPMQQTEKAQTSMEQALENHSQAYVVACVTCHVCGCREVRPKLPRGFRLSPMLSHCKTASHFVCETVDPVLNPQLDTGYAILGNLVSKLAIEVADKRKQLQEAGDLLQRYVTPGVVDPALKVATREAETQFLVSLGFTIHRLCQGRHILW